LSSSIPLTLHSGPQTLVAPEQSGIRSAHVSYHDTLLAKQVVIRSEFPSLMILSPARRTSSPSHPMISGVRSAHSPSQMNPRPGPALHPSTKE